MDGQALFAATVPVLTHYIHRLNSVLGHCSDGDLAHRLSPDMFPASEQFAVAQGFSMRAVCPLLGREVVELGPDEAPSRAQLLERSGRALAYLGGLLPIDFADAPDRVITHRAGQAELRQPAAEYTTLFALPNFFFHLVAGYAGLRAAGVSLGKGDFDGQHEYAPGFRFS